MTLSLSSAGQADDSSWMEDNLYRFRNNDLTTLSFPASHDAGMYMHHLGKFEIGVDRLYAEVSLDGPLVPDVSFDFDEEGVVEAGELLQLFDQLMAIVHAVDTQCIEILDVIEECVSFGLEDKVWDWVGEYYTLATGKPGDLSITQNLDLYGQLSSGVRRFDLRPKVQGGVLYIHHSQGGLEGIGHDVDYEKSLSIHVPCVTRPIFGGCITGTDETYTLGTFRFEAGGKIESVSATGPRVAAVLDDVRRYMEEGHREFVVLDFSAFWPDNAFGAGEYQLLVDMIRDYLGPWLLTEDMLPGSATTPLKERLLAMRLAELVGDSGHVLATNADASHPGSYTDPAIGIWHASVVSGDGSYSNKDTLAAMMPIQLDHWMTADGPRYQLWWTLTCQPGGFDCSVRDLAAKANPELPGFVDSLTIPNTFGTSINEIWVDFADETAATEIAIRLNPVAALIDVKPGNAENVINPFLNGGVWVAVVSDPGSLADPLQVDPATVRFGPGGAVADRYKVRDVNGDGLADVEFRFAVPAAALACGQLTVTLTGETYAGQRFIGSDSIATVGCDRGNGAPKQKAGRP